MRDESVREIGRHLAQGAASGITTEREPIDHVRWALFKQLESLPDPESGTIWLREDVAAGACWLTAAADDRQGRLFVVASAAADRDDPT